MFFLSPILLGLAVSLDGMGAGFAYGMRKVHIPPLSLFIICLSSSFSIFLSMTAGSLAAAFFSAGTAKAVGSVTMTVVGVAIFTKALADGKNGEDDEVPAGSGGKGLLLIQTVMREPSKADMDASGAISGKEAMVLGVALAMDAFGAGFGAAMMGFSPLVTSFAVGVGKYFFLSLGSMLGRRCARHLPGSGAPALAGGILIMLGLATWLH